MGLRQRAVYWLGGLGGFLVGFSPAVGFATGSLLNASIVAGVGAIVMLVAKRMWERMI
jgi:hypothetical protein